MQRLTFACGLYDRMLALYTGEVKPLGIDLEFRAMEDPREVFDRMAKGLEFDVAEMSSSEFISRVSAGQCPFVAIPVFPSRVFRQNALYVRADSPLREPRDLRGKRVGVADYQMTAAVWTRGLLQHEYGVAPEDMTWIVGRPIRAIRQPQEVRIEALGGAATLEELLERGEIDALMSVMIPKALGTTVKRLIPDFRAVELAYYRKTKIFPIMHTFVLRRRIYDANPWLAVNLYRAFLRARDLAQRHMYDTDALTVSLPWVIDEIERSREIAWDYSIEGSRPTLAALLQYLDEQSLTRRRMAVAELFAANVDPALGAYLEATGENP